MRKRKTIAATLVVSCLLFQLAACSRPRRDGAQADMFEGWVAGAQPAGKAEKGTETKKAAEARTRTALERPFPWGWTEPLHLTAAVLFIRENTGLDVQLTPGCSAQEGPMLQKPVVAPACPLKVVLKRMLKPHGLSYTVDGSRILIGRTESIAEPTCRVHGVEDVLWLMSVQRGRSFNQPGECERNARALARLILWTVEPESWQPDRCLFIRGKDGKERTEKLATDGTGKGGIFVRRWMLNDFLIIQTPEVQYEVARLLDSLRKDSEHLCVVMALLDRADRACEEPPPSADGGGDDIATAEH